MLFDQSFVDFLSASGGASLYAGPTLDMNFDYLQAICYTNLKFC